MSHSERKELFMTADGIFTALMRRSSHTAPAGASPVRVFPARARSAFARAALPPLLLILAACGDNSTGINAAPPPPEAGVITVTARPLTLVTELSGRTAPLLIAEVRPQVDGIIQERLFEEGADVSRGMSLYRIDPALYRARVNSAAAALEKARANAAAAKVREERYRRMRGSQAIGEQDYDDALAAHKQALAEVSIAAAELDYANIQLERTAVLSPISGRIGKSSVTRGALVTANQPEPLATVQQLHPMYVDVTQSSAEYMRLKREMERGLFENAGEGRATAELIMEDGAVYSRKGTVQFSDITVNRDTGSITLRIKFDNPDCELLPNVYVRARLQTARLPRGITLPQRAVSRDAKGRAFTRVVAANGTVERRYITTLGTLGEDWLVQEGVAPGEKVAVDGIQNIRFTEGGPAPVVTPVDLSPQAPGGGNAAGNAAKSGKR